MTRKSKRVSEPLTPPRLKSRGLLIMVLLVSFGLLVAGLLLPALHVSTFGFVGEDVSILGGIRAFYDDGQVFLATLIFVVSAAFPVVKIFLALLLSLSYDPARPRSHRIAATLSELARWSMTDVFILALAVMVIDARLISSADLRPGAYLFASAIILSAAAVTYLRVSLKRHSKSVTN